MEIDRMLQVIGMRFRGLRPATRKVSDEKFVVEVDNYARTGRIAIRGIVGLDNVPKYHSADVTQPDGRIEPMTDSDKIIAEEVKKVIQQALV